MDPQLTTSREDLYHVQMDIKHVQAVQTNHADRLLRLEKRQADDAALKSVWGTGSPFPGILSGTPQQGPVPNSANNVFDDFDDEQGQNLLGSLQLEADEEPVRRGASRANSVRFDVSALQGSNWAAGSRNSGEFAPVRPHSGFGFGSHPMTERSLSHKSDGRHSSAGHSVHSVPSGRNSSLGLDTNFIVRGQNNDSPLDIPDPPPGLFILGSVPSIIRCWLTTRFSHSTLLYAALCTGSQRSLLEYTLVQELGLSEQIHTTSTGCHIIRLPVYLPEAVISQAASRSISPAPQLPALTVDFEIFGLSAQHSNTDRKQGIRVFLGSDALRAHNADILFSQNLMTLVGDDRNKLSVPFVRPEDENLFKNLCAAHIPPEKNELKATAPPFAPTNSKCRAGPMAELVSPALTSGNESTKDNSSEKDQPLASSADSMSPFTTISTSDLNTRGHASSVKSVCTRANASTPDSEPLHEQKSLETASTSEGGRRESSGGIWGSWRHGSSSMSNGENSRDNESTSGYQRATRGGRSMKVLRPSKSISSGSTALPRSASVTHTGAAYEPAPSHSSGESRRNSQVNGAENVSLRWEAKREEQKMPQTITTISRSSNPVGGASAFAWMNPSKPKATTAE